MRNRPWTETSFVALDLETSGKYPLESDICEMAAIKYENGVIVDRFETLIRPRQRMGEEVIAIHHITNEMVEQSPRIEQKINDFYNFFKDSHVIAHHAPFDLGFLTLEFERAGLMPPVYDAVCTSLLARKVFPEIGNHRLKTLVEYFKIPAGPAHRALADAEACLQVALRCFQRVGEGATVQDIFAAQTTRLRWLDYSMEALKEREATATLIRAIEAQSWIQMVYQGGSKPGMLRRLRPLGVVRNPEGDFAVACEEGATKPKRYLLQKIQSVNIYSP